MTGEGGVTSGENGKSLRGLEIIRNGPRGERVVIKRYGGEA